VKRPSESAPASATDVLGAFAASLAIDGVDAVLVAKAKDHLLDTIGVACAGLSDEPARAVTDVVVRWGGAPEATVIGQGGLLPAPKAAYVNALHARIHTFDDTHEAGPSHPGSAVTAAALAAAEAAHASGAQLLAALLAGYETATRVSAALGASHYRAGFHSTGTATPFGAAAAASRARRLDASRTAAALSLAGGAAAGLRQYQDDGSMLDSAMNGARGAEAGVAAAALADAGATGPHRVLDGPFGVLNVMRGTSAEALTAGLGERWEFAGTKAKPYASCRFTHGPVAALRAAELDPRDVSSVEIAAFRESVEVSDRPRPRDRTEAILSHQLAAALALLGRPIVPADLARNDAAAWTLAERVRVRHDPALDALYPERWPHRIAVTLRDGRTLRLESDAPPAADAAQIRAKFIALATPVLGASRTEEVIEAVDGLERLPTVQPLLRLLQAAVRSAA
jgi:2-methylcitrate dehydratase PrpD